MVKTKKCPPRTFGLSFRRETSHLITSAEAIRLPDLPSLLTRSGLVAIRASFRGTRILNRYGVTGQTGRDTWCAVSRLGCPTVEGCLVRRYRLRPTPLQQG